MSHAIARHRYAGLLSLKFFVPSYFPFFFLPCSHSTGTSVGHHRGGSDFGQRKGRVQRQGGSHSGLAVGQRHAAELGDLSGHEPVSDQQHEVSGQRRRTFLVRRPPNKKTIINRVHAKNIDFSSAFILPSRTRTLQVAHLAVVGEKRGRPVDRKVARQSHGRDHVFRHNVRLAADNHRLQRHVVESVANQRRQTITGSCTSLLRASWIIIVHLIYPFRPLNIGLAEQCFSNIFVTRPLKSLVKLVWLPKI